MRFLAWLRIHEVLCQIFVLVGYFLKVPGDDVEEGGFEGVGVAFFVEDALAEVGELVVLFFEVEEGRKGFVFALFERVGKSVCVLEGDEECAA